MAKLLMPCVVELFACHMTKAELLVPRVAELFVRHANKAELFTSHGQAAGRVQMLDLS